MADLHDIVLAALRNRYVVLPQEGRERLADEIVSAVLEHLHETGALSVPPEDLTDPHNATP